jgi:GntR family transcriptional regulator
VRERHSLDGSGHIPLYVQLYQILKSRIHGAVYEPGEAIPSETVLTETYGITRGTVRHAISLLVAEGLVKQVRGKGTIVTYTPITYSVWNFSGFTEYAEQIGRKPVTRVIGKEILERETGSWLRMVRARGFSHLDRVQYMNIDESLVSLDLFPGLDRFDFETESLYRVFREVYNVPPDRIELSLAVTPVTEVARTYFETADVPGLLCASGKVFDSEDRAIEETSVLYSPSVSLNVVAMMNGSMARTGDDA